jgi:L-threonylcarbamoyladenylate synthase
MAKIGKDVDRAAQHLLQGDLVAIPTETVYGLAANALRPSSVARIFEVKQRPHFNPLIIHVPSPAAVENYVAQVPPKAHLLMNFFWPGPLALVLPRKPIIPDLVTAGLDTVGVRCPDHALTHTLLEKLQFPLAAPSANPFGYVSPTRASHVAEQLGDKIPYILDGGSCRVGIESTIIGFEQQEPVVYRLGGLSLEHLEQVVGKVSLQLNAASDPRSPGQLRSHYAPSKKIILGSLKELLPQYDKKTTGLLSFSMDYGWPHQRILSASGNVNEAAQVLFQCLREVEQWPVHQVIAEMVPHIGLGRAINDRLKRAASAG